jgi:hypothetical protein
MLLDRTDEDEDVTLPSSTTRRECYLLPNPVRGFIVHSSWIRWYHFGGFVRLIAGCVCDVVLS